MFNPFDTKSIFEQARDEIRDDRAHKRNLEIAKAANAPAWVAAIASILAAIASIAVLVMQFKGYGSK